MLIYKIFRIEEWAELDAEGETLGAPVDLADGFIHFSTAPLALEGLITRAIGTFSPFLLTMTPFRPFNATVLRL